MVKENETLVSKDRQCGTVERHKNLETWVIGLTLALIHYGISG